MPARVVDINDPDLQFPELIVLDASIVLWLRPDSQQSHNNFITAISFFNRLQPLANQGRVKPILPLLAFEECLFKICQFEINAHIQNIGLSNYWVRYYKQNPQVLLRTQSAVDNFCQILQAFPIIVTEPEDLAISPIDTEARLADRMKDLIYQFLILPKDATILGEAERLGIDTVVTLDNDWTRADAAPHIHLPLHHRHHIHLL